MNHHYADIIERIPDAPKWWDEHAVPRYCDFDPTEIANIYAKECALLLIECQNCETPFHVCISRTAWETSENARTLGSIVLDDEIHYGDPPNTGCCAAGATMNSVPVRVLEFWLRVNHDLEWRRQPGLEREIDPSWTRPGTVD